MLDLNIKKQIQHFDLQISLRLEKGTLAIVGHSGCGKSTTLNTISGLIAPDEGHILVDETVLFDSKKGIDLAPEDRGIGYVFQNYALFPHMTVYENIGYGLEAQGIRKDDRRIRIHKVMEMLGITHLAKNLPANCSGGEQQRVALARALVIEPSLLILDEPLSALDVTTRSRVRRELKKTLTALQIPTIIVTHDYDDAISLGDSILVMDKGRVIQQGSAQDLLYQPQSAFVADFSGTNYFTAEVLEHLPIGTKLQIKKTNLILFSSDQVKDEHVSFMIHPWNIGLFSEYPPEQEGSVFEAKVINVLFYGNRARVDVEGDLTLTIDMPHSTYEERRIVLQQEVYVQIRNEDVHLLPPSEQQVG